MKKIKLLAMAALVIAAGAFFLTNENLVKADVTKDTVIEDGVYIGGIDVSGMTAEEATKAVDKYVAGLQEEWITLVGPKDTLKYQLKDLGLSAKTSVAVKEAVGIGNAGSLVKRFKALQDLEKENYVVDMGLSVDKQLTANKIHSKRSKIDIKAIDNAVKKEGKTFVYVPGQAGDEVDVITAVNELNEYIGTEWETAAVKDAEFKLVSIVSQPRGTEEELSVIKDLIGTFSTGYKGDNWGRNKNVETGTAKMNGTILYPGDVFSVYECVSPFTKENGYELAGSYSNGETVQSYGGGICQVTTTLYQAVLQAELEIVQRFNHSMTVAYVPPGGDAAISGTYKDFRFRNNYDFPILLDTACKNGNIVINIYGVETHEKNRKVTYESEILSENIPETEFTLSGDLPVGTYNQTKGKMIGYVANYWKVVKIDGVEKERTLVNKSTYRSSAARVTIGIGGATAEQIAAINAAIEAARVAKDDSGVEALVASYAAPATTTPQTGTTTPGTGNTTTPDKPETQKPETDKPETQKPEHKCDYTTLKKDDNNHWYECSCGKTTGKEAHEYSDETDTTCDTCGHTREVESKPEDSDQNTGTGDEDDNGSN